MEKSVAEASRCGYCGRPKIESGTVNGLPVCRGCAIEATRNTNTLRTYREYPGGAD